MKPIISPTFENRGSENPRYRAIETGTKPATQI